MIGETCAPIVWSINKENGIGSMCYRIKKLIHVEPSHSSSQNVNENLATVSKLLRDYVYNIVHVRITISYTGFILYKSANKNK